MTLSHCPRVREMLMLVMTSRAYLIVGLGLLPRFVWVSICRLLILPGLQKRRYPNLHIVESENMRTNNENTFLLII